MPRTTRSTARSSSSSTRKASAKRTPVKRSTAKRATVKRTSSPAAIRRSHSQFLTPLDGMIAKQARGSEIVVVKASSPGKPGEYVVKVNGKKVGTRPTMSAARRLRYKSESVVTAGNLNKLRTAHAKRTAPKTSAKKTSAKKTSAKKTSARKASTRKNATVTA